MKTVFKVMLVWTAVTGAVFFIMACAYTPILNAIIQYKMNDMLTLSPDSYSFPFWKKPPVPVYFHIYVFDVTNPDEILNGAVPNLVQKGPYVYRVDLVKTNITFNANKTVTYRQPMQFHFIREKSVGWDNETFTTPNAPLFTLGALLQYELGLVQEAVNDLIEALGEQPFITVSAHDIFWGYQDRFLTLAKDILDRFHIHSDLITGTFGFYMGRNNTDDGLYTVHTGEEDLSKFLIIDRWNGEPSLNVWSTAQANMINGTDGSLYPPFVTSDRVLQMYDSNIFRSISMKYKEKSDVMGLSTMRFVVEDNQFANATVNPMNAGFCTPLHNCMPSGVLNSSSMGHGAPLFVSLPHMLGADPYYFRRVEGQHPNPALHQPYFDLHQLTGVCLSAGRRYQLNLQIKEYHFLKKTRGLSLSYVPVLWLDGTALVDNTTISMFKDQIERPLAIVNAFRYVMLVVGPLMIIIPLLVLFRHKTCLRRNKKKEMASYKPTLNGTARNTVMTSGNEHIPHSPPENTTIDPNERTRLIS